MSKRAAISQKLRFGVFKRDKFTCQYCGAKAPDVVLQVDHIEPVAKGGSNDLLNLLTSCKTCNGGKGAIRLADNSALEKQRDVLAELEERRQQIEMMLDWRRELQSMSGDEIAAICKRIRERSGLSPNESGKADIRKWMRKFSIAQVLRAVDEAFDAYEVVEEGAVTTQSWNLAFSKVPVFADIIRQEVEEPHLRKLLYIQGIIRKKIDISYYDCIDYLKHLVKCGADIEDMERRAKRMPYKGADFFDFEKPYEDWLKSIGRPF